MKDKLTNLRNRLGKRGSVVDLFIFMIFSFIIIMFIAIFIYMGLEVEDQMKESMSNIDYLNDNNINYTQIIDDTIGKYNTALSAFYWLTILLIIGMVLAIWISAYLTNTKPVFFISSIFIMIIAVVVAVVMSNAYETIIYANEGLTPIFENFIGANWIMLKLPIWVTIIGFISYIIMYSKVGKREEAVYGY